MPKQCMFYFCGREADGGGSFPLTAGASPSMAAIRLRLSYTYNQIGDLVISDGQQSRTFRNCKLARATVTEGGGGLRWRELQIYDRRWAWAEQYGGVYGAYNLDGRGPGDVRNVASARDLGAILCNAMGEFGYDVSYLPSNVYPRVDWSGENPATELEQLAKRFACFITLSSADRLVIRREGQGQTPTNDPRQMDFTYSEELPIIPRALCFEGDSILCQHDLPLVPVGLETYGANKGRLLPIAQLSYTPSNGWGAESPDGFFGVTDKSDRATAKKYVWRYYQIAGPFQLPVPTTNVLPKNTSGKIDSSGQAALRADFFVASGDEWRVLPIEQDLLPCFKDATENEAQAPAIIGYFATGGAGVNNFVTLPSEATNSNVPIADVPLPQASHSLLYDGSWQLEHDRGLVIFEQPVFLLSKSGDQIQSDTHQAARIRLRCAFPIRAKANAARLASQYWTTPGSPVSVAIVKKLRNSEMGLEYGLKTKNNATAQTSNVTEFIALANGMLQQEMASYSIGRGYSSPWKGFIFDKDIDGVIRNITWDLSEAGEGTTSIDYNIEPPGSYVTLDQMRLSRQQTALAVQAEMMRKASLRRNKKNA